MVAPMRETSWKGIAGASALAAMVALGLGGCQGDEENLCTDKAEPAVDEEADFTSYKTFAVAPLDGSGLGGFGGLGGMGGRDTPDKVEKNLEVANDAVASELVERGLKKVDPTKETPDLWIGSAAATEVETGVYWYCVPGYYWWGWYPYWDPCAWMAPYPFKYTEGTVLIALVDSETNKPVFGGVIQGVLECSDDIDGRVEAGVDQIFQAYPED